MMELNIQGLIDDKRCYETVRKMRWPTAVICIHCKSNKIRKKGKEKDRQRYQCKACHRKFDDLSGTVFSGHHQPLKTWIIFLYFLGLNLSTHQIAKELDLNKDDAQAMADILRSGVVEKKPEEILVGEIECDEVYVVAGHKGRPDSVKKRAVSPGETA